MKLEVVIVASGMMVVASTARAQLGVGSEPRDALESSVADQRLAASSVHPSNAVGEGYSVLVVFGDLAAAALVPFTILPTLSNDPQLWSPLSGAPILLTGPLIHAAHGRWIPAAASFLGWASVVATSWVVGLTLQPHSSNCGDDNGIDRVVPPCIMPSSTATETAVGVGVGVGIVGTLLMTALDGWMARSIKRSEARHVSFAPNAWVSGDGARAGMSGRF